MMRPSINLASQPIKFTNADDFLHIKVTETVRLGHNAIRLAVSIPICDMISRREPLAFYLFGQKIKPSTALALF